MKYTRKITVGDSQFYTPKLRHLFVVFTFLPAIILSWIGSVLFRLVDILLMDTHHIQITATPKKPLPPVDKEETK